MIPHRTVLFSAAIGLAAFLPAQDPATPAKPPVEAKQPDAAAKNVDQLIRDLGNDSYRTRLDAERKLREIGDAAMPALRSAAGGTDPEVQWRARRVMRQIEQGQKDVVERDRADTQEPQRRRADAQDPQQGPDDRGARRRDPMRQQFESLFENFERDFGVDIPRARFFDDSFFRDLQDQLRNAKGGSQAMSVQIGPDGAVRVEVQEKNDKGEPEKKVYEAPDMDSFQRQYPGVLRQNGLFFGMQPFANSLRGVGPTMREWSFDWPNQVPNQGQGQGQNQLTPRLYRFDRSNAGAPIPEDMQPMAPPPAGLRLGVSIRPQISAELRDHLGLADDTGMMVESVQTGSLAEALGLQRGDIVTAIGSHKIGGPEDVQEALGAIAKGQQVDVKFLRKGAEKTASTAKTEDVVTPVKGVEPRQAKPKPDETIR